MHGIGEDEPVMLFRAQDALAPLVLESYAALLRERTDEVELAVQVQRHADRMRAWQEVNGKQFPDVYPHNYLGENAPTPDEDTAPVEQCGTAPAQPDGPTPTGPAKEDGHWPTAGVGSPEEEDPTAIPEGDAEVIGMSPPMREDPNAETEAVNEAMDDNPDNDGSYTEPPSESPAEEDEGDGTPLANSQETGPLTDAGSELMGGQPTEHGK